MFAQNGAQGYCAQYPPYVFMGIEWSLRAFASMTRWEIIFIHIGTIFWRRNYSASIYLIHFKLGTVKDIFMVSVSMVLDFWFFCIFGGKMTS